MTPACQNELNNYELIGLRRLIESRSLIKEVTVPACDGTIDKERVEWKIFFNRFQLQLMIRLLYEVSQRPRLPFYRVPFYSLFNNERNEYEEGKNKSIWDHIPY